MIEYYIASNWCGPIRTVVCKETREQFDEFCKKYNFKPDEHGRYICVDDYKSRLIILSSTEPDIKITADTFNKPYGKIED